jgi:hypothetical protein
MKNRIYLLVVSIGALFLGVAACTSNSSKSEQRNALATTEIRPLEVDPEGWGGDIKFSMVEKKEDNSSVTYKALSTLEGEKLGFLVVVPKSEEKGKGFGSGLILKSIGKESDNLLRFLAQLYKQPTDSSMKFTPEVSLNYVDLSQFAKSLGGKDQSVGTRTDMKLFFEGNGDGEYAEVFLNVDSETSSIELREKDEEYRSQLIRFLQEKKE